MIYPITNKEFFAFLEKRELCSKVEKIEDSLSFLYASIYAVSFAMVSAVSHVIEQMFSFEVWIADESFSSFSLFFDEITVWEKKNGWSRCSISKPNGRFLCCFSDDTEKNKLHPVVIECMENSGILSGSAVLHPYLRQLREQMRDFDSLLPREQRRALLRLFAINTCYRYEARGVSVPPYEDPMLQLEQGLDREVLCFPVLYTLEEAEHSVLLQKYADAGYTVILGGEKTEEELFFHCAYIRRNQT